MGRATRPCGHARSLHRAAPTQSGRSVGPPAAGRKGCRPPGRTVQGALLAPAITRRLVERHARLDPETATLHRDLDRLTPRELEVLGLLARGLSNAELAAHLHLSETTIKTHVGRILAKLGLRDRVQAVVVAYETGLVSPGGPRTASPAADRRQ